MKQNKKIYLVGGAIRDRLMGNSNNDRDFVAVGYTKDDFQDYQLVGKDFPVFLDKDGNEIALARIERKISSGYNGFEASIENVSLEDDLKRRDLTINSIAYDDELQKYIDPFGGIDDIKNKILRHTSKAFVEDPIRVLRIARFKARFTDFTIAQDTKDLIYSMRDELKYLESNRVYKEIKKVFEYPNSDIFFKTLLELKVLDVIFPNLYRLSLYNENNIYHQEENIFIHTMMVLKNLDNSSNLLKFTALFHDIAKPNAYIKSNFKNASGHDNIDNVIPLIDILLPKKIEKDMLFLIKNHLRIYMLDKMRANKIATFFESYNKNKELFLAQIIFAKADNEGRIGIKKENLHKDKLLQIFDEISAYSPKKWIDENNITNGKVIKQHIHRVNINIVKRLFYNHI